MGYDELDLRTPAEEPSVPAPPPEPRHPHGIFLAVVLLVAVAAGGYYAYRTWHARGTSSAPAASTPLPSPNTPPRPLGTEAEAVTVPPLDESDDTVRQLTRMLSSDPTVAAWLATDDLIRTFTVVVSNIASGESPTGHVPALKPRQKFLVVERGEDLEIDARSYRRYNALATAASSIDPAGAARLYTTLRPRIEEAYRELGYPDTPFDQTLERAIVLLLRTPVPAGPTWLELRGGVSYRFADPSLERLNPAQKLLIRFGPENQRAVQTSLRAIAIALGIPPERLP